MKTIITLALLAITLTASAQKVTRKVLEKALAGDTTAIKKVGFVYDFTTDEGEPVYTRFNNDQAIIFATDDSGEPFISFQAIKDLIEHKKGVWTSPKGDLFWNAGLNRWEWFEDNNGELYMVYTYGNYIYEYSEYDVDDRVAMEVILYKK